MAGIRLARQSDSLSLELERLHHLKVGKEQSEALFREQEERVAKILEGLGQTSAVRETAIGKVKATVVRGHTTKINEVTLKKALGAAMWKKVTKVVLDRAKLEDLVSDGEIDPTVVAAHATIEPKKVFVRLSAVVEEGTEKENDAT